MAGAIVAHFAKPKNQAAIDNLLKELVIEKEVIDEGIQNLKDMTIVITGSLYKFDNRKELQDLIEKHGGKATGSVTAKTSILINNDIQSGSSKNKKAKELGIPIMTEEEFVAKYL